LFNSPFFRYLLCDLEFSKSNTIHLEQLFQEAHVIHLYRSSISTAIRISAAVLTLAAALCFASSLLAQEAASKPTTITASQLGQLEFQMRYHGPDSQAFGQADGAYWKAITETQDFPRAYSFFAALSDEAKEPNATLLACKASAQGAYISWLYQNHLNDEAGEGATSKLMASSIAEFKQALAIDPDNFAALYGYAVFEGYRPDGKAHQQELLAKLDTLRPAKPYLPWALVDQLEKTGRPE
jgi:hypothetical protein